MSTSYDTEAETSQDANEPQQDLAEETSDETSDTEAAEADESAASDEDDAEADDISGVPYQRFQSINAERRKWRDRAKQSERQLAELREQMLRHQAKPRQERWLDDDDDDQDEVADERPAKQDGVQSHLQYLYQQQIRREVSDARRAYPELPEEYLYKLIADHPQDDVSDLAAQAQADLDAYKEQIRQSILADAKKKSATSAAPTKTAKPGAAPRPPRAAPAPSNSTKSFKSIAEATEALWQDLMAGRIRS